MAVATDVPSITLTASAAAHVDAVMVYEDESAQGTLALANGATTRTVPHTLLPYIVITHTVSLFAGACICVYGNVP